MSFGKQALKASNLDSHLRKASAFLRRAVNQDQLLSAHPWQEFLTYIESIADLTCSTIAVSAPQAPAHELNQVIASTWPEEVIQNFLEQELLQDPLVAKVNQGAIQSPGHCLVATETVSLGEFKKSRFYNDFAKPNQVDALAQVIFPVGPNNVGTLSVFQSSGRYELSELKRKFLSELSEDLSMALRHHALLKKELLSEAALDRLQMGVVLINEQGLVSFCNRRAEEILARKDLLLLQHRRLVTKDEPSTKRLKQIIDQMIRGQLRHKEQEIILKSPSTKLPLQMIALSLDAGLEMGALALGHPVAIFINWPFLQGNIPADFSNILVSFYGCSQKQARVVELFTQGFSESQIGQKLAISKETARSHLAQAANKLKDSDFAFARRKHFFLEASHKHRWPLRKN